MEDGSTKRSSNFSAGHLFCHVGVSLFTAWILVVGCSERDAIKVSRKFVQHSHDGPSHRIVSITKEGVFQPGCTEIKAGQIVEWRNANPTLPTNVTSLGTPTELFSPNLVVPYNYCEAGAGAEGCAEIGTNYVYWRHQFSNPGLFEYLDTNSAQGGRVVRDDYYGTVTVVGLPDSAVTGLVCVAGVKSDGTEQACDEVCCATRLTCPAGYDCIDQRCVQP